MKNVAKSVALVAIGSITTIAVEMVLVALAERELYNAQYEEQTESE